MIESEDEVAVQLAQDAVDELTFASGSNLLLVDIGVESEEESFAARRIGRRRHRVGPRRPGRRAKRFTG